MHVSKRGSKLRAKGVRYSGVWNVPAAKRRHDCRSLQPDKSLRERYVEHAGSVLHSEGTLRQTAGLTWGCKKPIITV
jgi:hypothetical protein